MFKAIEIHRKTSLGFTGKSPLEVAGFPARTAGNRLQSHRETHPPTTHCWLAVDPPKLAGNRHWTTGRRRQPAVVPPEIGLPVGFPFVGSTHGSAGFAPSGDLPHQSVFLSVSLSLSRFCLSLFFTLSRVSRFPSLFQKRREEEGDREKEGETGSLFQITSPILSSQCSPLPHFLALPSPHDRLLETRMEKERERARGKEEN